MPFLLLSGIPDLITHAKCYVNRLRGFRFSGQHAPNSAISYTYSNDPYNSSALPYCVVITGTVNDVNNSSVTSSNVSFASPVKL